MAMEKLPEVNPPSGRVPGQRLLAAPDLEMAVAEEQRTDQEKGLAPEGFHLGG